MHLQTRQAAVLTTDDMRKIYEAAIRVVRRVPLRCQGTDEFNALLSDFGCRIDGDRVHFPDAVVDKVVGLIAECRDQARARGTGRRFGRHV